MHEWVCVYTEKTVSGMENMVLQQKTNIPRDKKQIEVAARFLLHLLKLLFL